MVVGRFVGRVANHTSALLTRNVALALARLHTDPGAPSQHRPGIPERLDHITLKALARTPQQRYESIAQMCDSLLGQRTGQRPIPTEATNTGRIERQRNTTNSRAHNPLAKSPPRQSQSKHPGQPRLLRPLLIGLISAAILVVGLLIVRSPSTPPAGPTPTLLSIAAISEFDPAPGDGTEHHADLRNLIDNNPETLWSTESYKSQTFGNKTGVGVVLELSEVRKLSSDRKSTRLNSSHRH